MRFLCFEITFVGIGGEWKKIALMGADHKIEAIKAYRDQFPDGSRPGLKESKDKIEMYMWKHGICN